MFRENKDSVTPITQNRICLNNIVVCDNEASRTTCSRKRQAELNFIRRSKEELRPIKRPCVRDEGSRCIVLDQKTSQIDKEASQVAEECFKYFLAVQTEQENHKKSRELRDKAPIRIHTSDLPAKVGQIVMSQVHAAGATYRRLDSGCDAVTVAEVLAEGSIVGDKGLVQPAMRMKVTADEFLASLTCWDQTRKGDYDGLSSHTKIFFDGTAHGHEQHGVIVGAAKDKEMIGEVDTQEDFTTEDPTWVSSTSCSTRMDNGPTPALDHVDSLHDLPIAESLTPFLENSLSATFEQLAQYLSRRPLISWTKEQVAGLYSHYFRYQAHPGQVIGMVRRLEELGYRLLPVRAVGSCFYEAVSWHIFGAFGWHGHLRSTAVQTIRQDPDKYRFFAGEQILPTTLHDVGCILEKAMEPTEEATAITIKALAHATGIQIVIKCINGDTLLDWATFEPLVSASMRNPCMLLYTPIGDLGGHYDYLLPLNQIPQNPHNLQTDVTLQEPRTLPKTLQADCLPLTATSNGFVQDPQVDMTTQEPAEQTRSLRPLQNAAKEQRDQRPNLRTQPLRNATKAYQRMPQPSRTLSQVDDYAYCRAYTDGGYKRDLRSTGNKASFGARLEFRINQDFYAIELCGQVLKKSGDQDHSNNVGEFAAMREAAMVALQHDLRVVDFYTDSHLLYQTFTGELVLQNAQLRQIYQSAVEPLQNHDVLFEVHWVKGHSGLPGNVRADALATRARKEDVTATRISPRLRCEPFTVPHRVLQCVLEHRSTQEPQYQTKPPYAPKDPTCEASRGVADLVNEQRHVLFLCPWCPVRQAKCYVDRRALLAHMRAAHPQPGDVQQEVADLYRIAKCRHCKKYMAKERLSTHVSQCKGLQQAEHLCEAQKQQTNRTSQPPDYKHFEQEALDFTQNISFAQLFAPTLQTSTPEILHWRSQQAYNMCLAVTLEGCMATLSGHASDHLAFLKLLMELPSLLLYQKVKVTERARLYLSGQLVNHMRLRTMRDDFLKGRMIQREDIRRREETQPVPRELMLRRDIRRAEQLITGWDLTRALLRLQRHQRPEQSAENLDQTLADAHPAPRDDQRIPWNESGHATSLELFNSGTLEIAMRKLSKFAGVDATGHRAGHWQHAFKHRREINSYEMRIRYALEALFNKMLRKPEDIGDDEFWSFFTGARLTALHEGGKTRLVGSQNVLYKLLCKVVDITVKQDINRAVAPQHLAMIPSGITTSGVLARCWEEYAVERNDEPNLIMLGDGKSAFNHASRANILRQLKEADHLDEMMAPFYAFTQKRSQAMVYVDELRRSKIVMAEAGLVQGSTQGSELFCLGTTPMVLGLQEAGGQSMFVTANTDDINMHGPLHAIQAACAVKEDLQRDPNYVVNLSKQRIYLPNPSHRDVVQRCFPGHRIITPEDGQGVKIGGIPIGSVQYLRRIMQENIDSTAKAIEAILLLPSKQQQLLMLRSCIPGRIPHLLNVVDPLISREYAGLHDRLVERALIKILDLREDLTERERLQIQRKLSDHGLGFRSMEFSLNFLFLAGFARAMHTINQRRHPLGLNEAVRKSIDHIVTGEQGYGAALQIALEELRLIADDEMQRQLPKSLRALTDNTFTWHHRKIQESLDRIIARQHDAMYAVTQDYQQLREKALMMSIDATIFHICPTSKPLHLENKVLVHTARRLLGRPLLGTISTCPYRYRDGSACQRKLDNLDAHLATCRANSSAHLRHAGVQKWLRTLAEHAGLDVQDAPMVDTVERPSKSAADLLLEGASLKTHALFDGGKCIVDVVTVCPIADTYAREASYNCNSLLEAAQKRKMVKYQAAYRDCQETCQANFVPFAVTTGGIMGEHAKEMVKKLAKMIATYSGQNAASIRQHWRSRLQIIIAEHMFGLRRDAEQVRLDSNADKDWREQLGELYGERPGAANILYG